jgi:predicted ester cyclase
MNQYLIIFREPDGRTGTHAPETLLQHRHDMKIWMDKMIAGQRISGGNALTLNGKVIKGPRKTFQPGQQPLTGPQQPIPGNQQTITDSLYAIGTEIVGGFLLLNADSLEEATAITTTCPILDFGGFAEVRETMQTNPLPNETIVDTEPLSEQAKNKRIVRHFNTAFIQDGDTNIFYDIIDPQVINHSAPPGISNGADGMFSLIQAFKKALPGLTVEITHQVAEGDLVITRKAFHATHTGEIMGIPPSGKKITIFIIDIIRLRNGKYVEHWSIRDISDLIQKAKN